ncbi:hypothetical protein [Pluralibacter sp.]|uniref:hypothetical protein n=1 Tax=Pluralibacter sp. TaxID=1920032 RepID=UPI0025E83402|nr:hypothetical protein [Pluralibacter sp.]MBV8042597.1 hypothetical protein [Pluralibacter sp.]
MKNVSQWNVFYGKNGKVRSMAALLTPAPPTRFTVKKPVFPLACAMRGDIFSSNAPRVPGFPQK